MRRALPWVTALGGLALLVSGLVTFATGASAEASARGWFAYEPLPADRTSESRLMLAYGDGSVLWTGQQLTGAALVVAGLVLLAALGGWAVGRRAVGRARRGA